MPAVILRGLDPNRVYRLRELNLPDGAASRFSLNGQSVGGAALMRSGLEPPCRKMCDSAVIELAAEPPASAPRGGSR